MKVFSLKRLIGMAALYGIVRYVKAAGGPKAAMDDLRLRMNELMGAAKSGVGNLAGETGSGAKFGGVAPKESTTPSYASYKVGDDRNLH